MRQAQPPAIVRHGEALSGAVFWHGGRPLRVARVLGKDRAAPVIVEELLEGPAIRGGRVAYAAGQLALWSRGQVERLLRSQ